MTRLTRPPGRPPPQRSRVRLALLLAASLLAPAVLLTEALDRQLPAAAVIAVCSAVLYLLVISRLADATGSLRVALDRTYVLRAAGGRWPRRPPRNRWPAWCGPRSAR